VVVGENIGRKDGTKLGDMVGAFDVGLRTSGDGACDGGTERLEGAAVDAEGACDGDPGGFDGAIDGMSVGPTVGCIDGA